MVFAKPLTASTFAWFSPGENEFSTSAMTAMRISVSVMPISLAVGFGAAATGVIASAMWTSTAAARQHRTLVIPELRSRGRVDQHVRSSSISQLSRGSPSSCSWAGRTLTLLNPAFS